jgi:hypothetical protein
MPKTLIRIPGLATLAGAPKALTEPFGLPGMNNRFSSSDYASLAVGTAVAGPWLNKVKGGANLVKTGTVAMAAPATGDGVSNPLVSFSTASTANKMAGGSLSAGTAIAALATSSTGYTAFTLADRQLYVGAAGWYWERLNGGGGDAINIPFSAVPRNPAGSLALIVIKISADGASDTLTVLSGGKTTSVTGPVSRVDGAGIVLGKAAGASVGPSFAEFGTWPNDATNGQLGATVFPAAKKRFGIALPA